MRRREKNWEHYIGPGVAILCSAMGVGSGASGGGGGGGGGPSPSAIFQIVVNKGGNDTTGNGTDEAPFLTITKAYTVAKTFALSSSQFARVDTGPGQYIENLHVPPWVWTVGQGDVTLSAVQLDSAAWIAASAADFAQSEIRGCEITDNSAINYTGTGAGGVSFLFVDCGLGGTLTMTGDPTNGGGVFASETQFFGNIVATGLASVFGTNNCSFVGNLSFFSTAAQNCGWDSSGDSVLVPTSITITLDSTAGNNVVGNINSNLASPGSQLLLKGAGTTWRGSAGSTPNVVTRSAGAPAPIFDSPVVALNSVLPTGANAAAGAELTADGAGGLVFSGAGGAGTRAYYGDHSDGNLNVVGTVTLLRDSFYQVLNVPAGTTLKTNGFRVYADTIHLSGTIDNSGAAAVTSAHGAGAPGGSMFGGGDGADGVTATIASGDQNGTNSLAQTVGGGNHSGQGGTGGNGGAGVGGTGGALHTLVASFGDVRANPQATLGAFIGLSPVGGVVSSPISTIGGTGGGSGGAAAAVGNSTSGAGGGGGGCVLISCRILDGANTGVVSAKGGAGGAGALGNAGGGAGGGGGLILATIGDQSGYAGTFSAAGGAGGAPIGTGTNGGAGANGTVIQVQG